MHVPQRLPAESGRRCSLIASLILLAIAATPGYARSALFVNSAPIRAEVTVNGTAAGTTPLVLLDVEPGEYEITVIKPGYVPSTQRIEIGLNEVAQVTLRPDPDVFVGSFSAEQTIVGGETLSRQDSTLVLPSGVYSLTADGISLQLDPFYPNEGALAAARIATIAGGVAALIATAEDILVRGEATSFFTSYFPSPGTIAAWAITIGAGGFWLALAADREAYNERMVVEPFTGLLTPAQAERDYEAGEAALAAGNLSRALVNYTRVIAEGVDSEYIPDALYKSAQIYSISGDLDLARQLFELLVIEFPAPEVYDRAWKSLSDVYREQGEFALAITALEELLFVDDSYAPEEIEADLEAIREEASR